MQNPFHFHLANRFVLLPENLKTTYVFLLVVTGNDCIKIVLKRPEAGAKKFYYWHLLLQHFMLKGYLE